MPLYYRVVQEGNVFLLLCSNDQIHGRINDRHLANQIVALLNDEV